jgi:hypothetical protein
MKTLYYIMILVICLAPIAHSQVDTLEAIEVGTIQAPDTIKYIYVENLDNDSLLEIILCTNTHVYAYHWGNEDPFWSGPEMFKPDDLHFSDLDGDSLLDISVHDNDSLLVFNVYNNNTIFASSIYHLYCSHTLDDIDGDGFNDIALVGQELDEISERQDSALIIICRGPDFVMRDSCIIMYDNYSFYGPGVDSETLRQKMKKIVIASLGAEPNIVKKIFLFSNISYRLFIYHQGISSIDYYGLLWIIDTQSLQITGPSELGQSEYIGTCESSNGALLYSAMSRLTVIWPGMNPPVFYFRTREIAYFNEFGFINGDTILNDRGENRPVPDWTSLIGELNGGNSGHEICYNYNDLLKEYSIQNGSMLWSSVEPADSIAIIGAYNSQLFSSAEIIIKEILPTPQYLFVNGITHQVNTVLPNVIPAISQISDLDHDGNDEILSISGNTLHIYNLVWATPVAERPILPNEFLAVSNYPNPFNGQTIIKYNLPNQCDIALEIYDILGRKIESIEKPDQPSGLGQITWDASGEPSGVYFYRLSAGNEQKSGRTVLLK